MNRAIRHVAVGAVIVILALVAQLTYVQVFRADSLRADPRNSRVLLEEFARHRGQIDAGGSVLAESIPSDGRYPYQRVYPGNAEAFAPTIGYFSLQYATAGVEQTQEAFLSGTDDRLLSQRITELITGRTPQGGNVELTLSPAAQNAAYDALMRGAGQGPFVGSVAAVRPSTGEVLALASTPSFDPNALSSADPAVREAEMVRVEADPHRPLLNHATQQSLPPGSTMKVITTAALLENGFTASSPVSGAPDTVLPGTATTLTNYDGTACGAGGETTLRVAFEESCNIPFVQSVQDIGEDAFADVAHRFGIDGEDNEALGLPQADSTLGEIADEAGLSMSSIGQNNVAMTTLDNAMVAAAVSNNGMRMEPQVIRSLLAPDLTTVEGFTPIEAEQAIDPGIAGELTSLMLDAERHTGGGIPGVEVASKTGTAEHGGTAQGAPPYVWYIAFVPGEDMAVAVAVESGPGLDSGATGGQYAAPIGRDVLTALLNEGGTG